MNTLMKIRLSIIKTGNISRSSIRILIIGGSGSEKTKALLNLIGNQPDIDKIYLFAKDPYDAKYQYLINKREGIGINHFNDPKAFMTCIMFTKVLIITTLIKKIKY